jgi:ABC-type multidrug transport system permease subunit
MKKCPYCKTLVNDDINTCPRCLHDLSEVTPMSDIIGPKNFKTEFYLFLFSILIGIGGLFAGLSQKKNMENYYSLFKAATEESEQKRLYQLFRQSEFEMWSMWIISAIGALLLIFTFVLLIIHFKKLKRKENK